MRGVPGGAGFAPLSRMVRCAGGGWARTHANYPHHEAALRRALRIEGGVAELEAAARSLSAVELEDASWSTGGCAAALRTEAEWAGHPAGAAVLNGGHVRGVVPAPAGLATPGRPGRLSPELFGLRPNNSRTRGGASAFRPALGVRVLDLTRVIAGPVAGRTLAALGAEVLRVDPPGLPELPEAHLDTGPGKRSALLDLGDAGRAEALLAGADVLLTGYRPGALDRFGLAGAPPAPGPRLAQRLGARGAVGRAARVRLARAGRERDRGRLRSSDGTPGVLPAQALDHGTGHLMAAAALHGLAARERGEPVPEARLSLARTAAELLSRPRRARATPAPRTRTASGSRSARWS